MEANLNEVIGFVSIEKINVFDSYECTVKDGRYHLRLDTTSLGELTL
jgi:hypothetical protein